MPAAQAHKHPVSMAFDARQLSWRFQAAHCPDFILQNLRPRLELDRQWINLPAKNVKVTSRGPIPAPRKIIVEGEATHGLSVTLRATLARTMPAIIFDVELDNRSRTEMELGALHVMEFGEDCRFGSRPEALKVFTDSSGGWWAGVSDLKSKMPFSETVNADGYSEMKEQWGLLPEADRQLLADKEQNTPGFHNSAAGISMLVDLSGRQCLMVGLATMRRTSNNVTWVYRQATGALQGWAGCNFAGYRLRPGERIRSEQAFFGLYVSPFAALEDFAALAGKLMKAKFPKTPPMGWCSWYAYRLNVTEDIVLANARAIKDRFPGYAFKYIQVDHGWQYRNICGQWTETNERFPHGIKWLAARLRKMGYALGLWLGVTNVLASSTLFKEHPECLIHDQNGKPIVLGRWAWKPNDLDYGLDPTHPAAKAFLSKTFAYLRNAGCRYWKLDFMWSLAGNSRNHRFHNPRIVKGAGIYRHGLAWIARLLKGDYIYWCSNPASLGFGFGTTSMTACDIGNTGFSLARQVEGRTENVAYFRRCATTIISRYYWHKRLLLINPDVVEVGGPGDYEEGKIRLMLVALSGGQVFLGDKLTELTEPQWALLEKCLPPYGEAARPVDLFEHTHPDSYPHIWHLPIRTAWGQWDLVGLFNLTTTADEVAVQFDKLALTAGRNYLVFEFWSQRFLGIYTQALKVKLAPLSVQLLMIKECGDHPMVLATDMHITQGGVELFEVHYDARKNRLTGLAKRQHGSKGTLSIYVPPSFQGINLPPGASVNNTMLTLPIVFHKPACRWAVDFRRNA